VYECIGVNVDLAILYFEKGNTTLREDGFMF